MSDILDRLRNWGTVYPGDEAEGALYVAAAEEIERLRAALAEVTHALDGAIDQAWIERHGTFEAERIDAIIRAARAALGG